MRVGLQVFRRGPFEERYAIIFLHDIVYYILIYFLIEPLLPRWDHWTTS